MWHLKNCESINPAIDIATNNSQHCKETFQDKESTRIEKGRPADISPQFPINEQNAWAVPVNYTFCQYNRKLAPATRTGSSHTSSDSIS